jgi:hypothetical protein
MVADPVNRENREEQQRRELEEIRDSFRQIGIRMGSLFEPAQDEAAASAEPQEAQAGAQEAQKAGPESPERPQLPAPAPRRRTPGLALLAALAFAFLLVGGGIGYLLHRPSAAVLEPAAPTVITRTVVRDKPVAPRSCLETARRADETMDMLVRNVRDQRLALALKAYTVASQACRREASP